MSSSSHPLSIFREYILQLNDFPTENINPNTPNFDFILGFASEQGNGQFVPNWNVDALNVQRVRELKERYPNVRVVISIGGVGSEFNPTVPRDSWIDTAVSSISAIICQRYQKQIDGIDIHYDAIPSTNHEANFSGYIGGVIQRLKNDLQLIQVVSIAPTENIQRHYHQLYSANINNIDLVDYRFYNQKFASVPEFINKYRDLTAAYSGHAGKFLAGISTNPQDLIIFGGIITLIQNNGMPGVFVWNADNSLQNFLQNL